MKSSARAKTDPLWPSSVTTFGFNDEIAPSLLKDEMPILRGAAFNILIAYGTKASLPLRITPYICSREAKSPYCVGPATESNQKKTVPGVKVVHQEHVSVPDIALEAIADRLAEQSRDFAGGADDSAHRLHRAEAGVVVCYLMDWVLDQRREQLDDIRPFFLAFVCGPIAADDDVFHSGCPKGACWSEEPNRTVSEKCADFVERYGWNEFRVFIDAGERRFRDTGGR